MTEVKPSVERRFLTGLLSILPIFSACAQSPSESSIQYPEPITDWESALYLDHGLVGSVWHTHSNQFVSIAELMSELDSSRIVLLGEKHDNPDHHRLQQNILRYLLASDRVGAVSFEMMDSEFDDRLAELKVQQFDSLTQLKDHLQWDDKGWDWSFYGPLIADTHAAGIDVRSANISRAQVGEVYGQPLDPAIFGVMDEQAIEQLNIEIEESHCNMLPASQFPAMVRVQQARDHAMATSLSANDSSDRINVLIAGNYHVRQDLGAPKYLLALEPTIQRGEVVSLAILEVSPESDDPVDYLQAYSELLPFDYVWFTPAISDEDYCASLRTQ